MRNRFLYRCSESFQFRILYFKVKQCKNETRQAIKFCNLYKLPLNICMDSTKPHHLTKHIHRVRKTRRLRNSLITAPGAVVSRDLWRGRKFT